MLTQDAGSRTDLSSVSEAYTVCLSVPAPGKELLEHASKGILVSSSLGASQDDFTGSFTVAQNFLENALSLNASFHLSSFP